ncbi:MAG TPA: tetratricopeptide repeat protein [Acidobacteriota bacterium]|nr:tetratricopeptide repeat protein [Acidobacteriota bacterium]HMZ81980.1 tetratricopeptide repeat protein [Acidobacteriota bacterium]HNB71500.1 tetratricopeptide repeat protein [Acidobacteriota bacterium]HNG92120.1 tetratricopeptide repeat protein [Acidobacteriota bacterium]HNH81552.1 tetratricopeptide repeat protein [Acidobacteriota bacterium]
MDKKSLSIGITVGLLIGFFFGFYWTNAMNRGFVKEAEDKLRQAQANPAQSATSATPTGQPPNDDVHSNVTTEQATPEEIAQALDYAQKNRGNYEAQMNVGKYLYFVGKKLSEARACFEDALKTKPNDMEALVTLGNVSFDEQKYDIAQKHYEAALKLNDKDVNVRTDLGNTYFQRQQFDKAISFYQESLKLDPKHIPTLFNLASAQIRTNKMAEAKVTIDELAKVDPQNRALPDLKAALESASSTKRDIPTH